MNGSTLQKYIPQDEASSPTVTIDGVFLTADFNAKERRAVVVCDVSGAFLQARMVDLVIVVFEDEMVDILIKIKPRYAKYLHITKKGKKPQYMQLDKAMYGCLKAARLWWEDLSKFLTEEMGLII